MSEANKFLPLRDFRDLGFLQEANRQFFHPLGLALVMGSSEDGTLSLLGVWDKRDDPEGFAYPAEYIRSAEAGNLAAMVATEYWRHALARTAIFNGNIQPLK